ncbi:DUF2442 domain-containing protein [Glaciibacter superstes]|uniref:DUF2442 domain-containing protein n=1 Tax=Glaciibacter superstes TaxID=501023 RepID=UPI000524080B|nr:DUF2442 domain-containing protein [Glaciibacter superstes]
MSTLTRVISSAVDVSDDALRVRLADGREISAPLAWFPRLNTATQEQRNNWRLFGAGEGVHWAAVDEDVSVSGLLRAS